MILVLGESPIGLAEAVIAENLTGARGMRKDPIEDAAPARILVHAELDVVAEVAAALRSAEGERMADAGRLRALPGQQRVGRALGVGALVAQERHDIAGGGEADADDLRVGGVVPK